MLSDPIADMLTRIRNGQLTRLENVAVPYSKMKEAIAEVLKKHGYIEEFKVYKPKGKSYKYLSISLKYDLEGNPIIRNIDRVSKPGLRNYKKASDIRPVLGGLGIYIVSTSRGVLSSKEARKRNLGGEIICKVY